MLTTFWRTEIFAWSRGSGTAATSLFDAQRASLDDLALQTLLGGISLLGSRHLHEPKSARLLSVRVDHDRAALHVAIFLEQTRKVRLSQARMDAGHEQVRSSVDGSIIVVLGAAVTGWSSEPCY